MPKKFYEIGPSGQYYKTFLNTIDDFDWGYADSDVITSKKFYNIGLTGQYYKTFKA
jgi:hypothetical protein